MQIIKSILDWRKLRQQLASDVQVGFVPTMGNLHQGHLSLLTRSLNENAQTVLSIYINPTQFNQVSDFENYPKTLEQDLAMAEAAGVNYVFMPSYNEIYPDNYTYKVIETDRSQPLEGEYRPGHFEGMLTIVLKLLLLVKPNKAYFGEKDYQQLQLVRGMVDAFFLDTEIIACPIIREASGLPLSSRNNRLSAIQREKADCFAEIFQSTLSCTAMTTKLAELGFAVDYIVDYQGRRFAAVRIGDVRLIDNRELI